jgi:hypothetical protein
MQKWMDSWLGTSGLNLFKTKWDPAQQGEQTLVLEQTSARGESNYLRTHKLKIGFFDEHGKVRLVKEVYVPDSSKEIKVSFINEKYKAVLPSYGDLDFVLCEFDKVSQEFFLNNLDKLECPLSILLVLHSMKFMVKVGTLKSDRVTQACADALYANLANPSLLKNLCNMLSSLLTYLPEKIRSVFQSKVFKNLCLLISKRPIFKTQSQMIICDLLVETGDSYEDSLRILKIITKEDELHTKLTFSNKNILQTCYQVSGSSQNDPTMKKMVSELLSTLPESELKKNYLTQTKSMLADDSERRKLWEEVFCNPTREMSFVQMRFAARGFSSKYVAESRRKEYLEVYFEKLVKVLETEGKEIGRVWVYLLWPKCGDIEWVCQKYLELLERPLIQQHKYYYNIVKMRADDLSMIGNAWKMFSE